MRKAAISTRAVACGIDLGATDLWIVGLTEEATPDVAFAEHLHIDEFERLADILGHASTVAIDAPGGFSEGSHIGDERFARKFQRARCSEVALRRRGIAVPFATPMRTEPLPPWMNVGFETWRVAKTAAPTVVETFPHAIFWRLAGRELKHKYRADGRAARRAVLAPLVNLPAGVSFWPHDALDALACAVLAHRVLVGDAEEISCAGDLAWHAHDGSAMWLPHLTAHLSAAD
ncbi:MAG TPA: DUF429 domain-containing protein [Acidimicrobiales bacterium]